MDYFIVAVDSKGREFLGTQNAKIVKDAKSMVKVNNALKCFNPTKETKQIKVYSYTNLYNEKTFKLVRTINK
jgi:hypothetical protein